MPCTDPSGEETGIEGAGLAGSRHGCVSQVCRAPPGAIGMFLHTSKEGCFSVGIFIWTIFCVSAKFLSVSASDCVEIFLAVQSRCLGDFVKLHLK